MARLYETIFGDGGGDVLVKFISDEQKRQLRCHSIVLTMQAYFQKMLGPLTGNNTSASQEIGNALKESWKKEVLIDDDYDTFVEIIRFIYTSQLNLNHSNVCAVLTLADKYCVDEVLDLCLKFVSQNFNADAFYQFYNFMVLNTSYQARLKDQLMTSLKRRKNLCMITSDRRWSGLPVEFVEEILSADDLPIASEAEALAMISRWVGSDCNAKSKDDAVRLLGCFRCCDSLQLKVAELEPLLRILELDLFSDKMPRKGIALQDPTFVVHHHEAASTVGTVAVSSFFRASDHSGHYTLGPRDTLQQEPGWTRPGVHRLHVSLECVVWSHRERRLTRSRPSIEDANIQRLQTGRHDFQFERSASPPPKFQVRMPPIETFEAFELGQLSDNPSAAGFTTGPGVRSRGSYQQDQIDFDLVDHQILCGVLSGYQRHGVRFSQKDRNAIYLLEDLNGKEFISVGGSISSVDFDLELSIGEASKCGIVRCRFAVLRDNHTLIEEVFDVSAQTPMHFYFSSSYFDSSSTYSVRLRWA